MEFRDDDGNIIAYCTFEGGCDCLKDGEPAFEDCVNCPSLKFADEKVEVSNVCFLPERKLYKRFETVNVKPSPAEWDMQKRRRKHVLWLPRYIRKHPKIKEIFKDSRKRKRENVKPTRQVKTRGDRFNQLVEQAYKSGKL